VTGGSRGFDGYDDYATVGYDAATGAQLWVNRYDGPGGPPDDHAWALGVSPDGSKLFVTGGSVGSESDEEFATVAYSTG
jgi:hypothetical protein